MEIRRVCCFLNALHAPRCGGGSRFRSTGAPTTALQSACSCSRWLRTSLLGFYGGWRLAEKSPHSLRVALSVGRLYRKHFYDCVLAGWENLCQTTSSSGLSFHGPIFKTENLRKRVHHKGPPLLALRLVTPRQNRRGAANPSIGPKTWHGPRFPRQIRRGLCGPEHLAKNPFPQSTVFSAKQARTRL